MGIFREPVSGFNGWLRTAWKGYYISPENYIKSYKSLYNILNNIEDKKIILLKYENICEEGVSYINKKTGGDITLPPIDKIKKTNFSFGDPAANLGGSIKKPNMNNNNIPENTQNYIGRTF